MTKFQVHAASDILQLQHGASPGATRNRDLNWAGAKLGMAGKHGFATAEKNSRIAVVKSLNFQNSRGWEIVKEDAAFHFGLHNSVVNVVCQVGVRNEHNEKTFLGVYSKFALCRLLGRRTMEHGSWFDVAEAVRGAGKVRSMRRFTNVCHWRWALVAQVPRAKQALGIIENIQGMVAMDPWGPTSKAPPARYGLAALNCRPDFLGGLTRVGLSGGRKS